MPFKKNDPKTKEAARKGGTTGSKHLTTLTKENLRKISIKAGKASGVARRARKMKADRITERIMTTTYMEE